MEENIINSTEFNRFIVDIKERIKSSQFKALRAVNEELINLYLEIGKSIVQKQEEQGWGKSVVEMLAKELQLEFPGTSGFSARNVWYMRNLYFTYQDNSKLQQLVAEIGWSHNLLGFVANNIV